MPNVTLSCPHCHNRFEYHYQDGIDTIITCGHCGKILPWDTYTVILHCPHCHTNLEERLQNCNQTNFCPTCNAEVPLLTTVSPENLHAPNAITISASRQARLFLDGEYIDKYRVLNLIGRGAMAEVYLVEHAMLHKQYALKVMKPSLVESRDAVHSKRFLREAKLSMAIEHPNIVHVFDAGNDPQTGLLFIAMDYIDGEPLSAEVVRGPLSAAQLLFVAHEMAEALIALHKANIVHRDIKPSNILRSHDGSLKLSDLGIAKQGITKGKDEDRKDEDGDDSIITMTESAIGSPAYSSPEQCSDGHHVDFRSDIYNLGATLYHLATGRIPFKGGNVVETFMMVLNNKPLPLTAIRDDLPHSLCHLITKMMNKKPGKRPQTAEKLLDMVNRINLSPTAAQARPHLLMSPQEQEAAAATAGLVQSHSAFVIIIGIILALAILCATLFIIFRS